MLCFVMAGQVIWQCCSPDTILVLKKIGIIYKLYIRSMVSVSLNALVVTLEVRFCKLPLLV